MPDGGTCLMVPKHNQAFLSSTAFAFVSWAMWARELLGHPFRLVYQIANAAYMYIDARRTQPAQTYFARQEAVYS